MADPATTEDQPEVEDQPPEDSIDTKVLERMKKADLIDLITGQGIPVPTDPLGGNLHEIEAALQALHRIADALEDANRLSRADLTLKQMRLGHYPYSQDARYREAAHAVIGDLRTDFPAEG